MNIPSPCTDWAEKLALKSEDLTPSERVALTAHLRTCSACITVAADYQFLVAHMCARPRPTVRRQSLLLPELLYPQEDGKKENIPADSGIGSRYVVSHKRRPEQSTVLKRRSGHFQKGASRGEIS